MTLARRNSAGIALRNARRLLAKHERDPGFRRVVVRHNIVGMRLTGVLAIGLVVAFMLGSLIQGKQFVLFPGPGYHANQVAIIDKLFIILAGIGCLAVSKTRLGAAWGRLIVSLTGLVIIVVMILDDAARKDPSFAPVYVLIALITATGAMPYRPAQTFALALAAIAGYFGTLRVLAPMIGLESVPPVPGHLLLLILVGSMLTGMSLFLYNLRFQQYRVHRTTERLKARVERQAVSLAEKNRFIRRVFGRYLTDDVLKRLLESPSSLHLGGHNSKVTILMADIRGFSSLTERLDPEAVVTLLNTYLESMTTIIEAFGGTIDEFIGDAIMVIFGAPMQLEDDAYRAVACAVAMQAGTKEVNEKNAQRDLPEIEIGVAVHTGEAVVGNIGSERRAKYGVVGSVVNVTARIESYSVGGQILMTESTLSEIGHKVQVINELRVEPKGVSQAIRIFDVTGVGPPYNISVPRPRVDVKPIRERIPVRFSVLEEKFVGRTLYEGSLVAVSPSYADMASDTPVSPLSNLKLYFVDRSGADVPGDVFAKVTSVADDRSHYRLRFTTLSPESRAFLQDISVQYQA